MHGDRNVKDDKAMVGGFAQIDGETIMIIGQQKVLIPRCVNIETLVWQTPKVIEKLLRLMRLAEKFNKPVITFS